MLCYLGSSSPTEATSMGSGSHGVHAWLQQPINEFQMDSLAGLQYMIKKAIQGSSLV